MKFSKLWVYALRMPSYACPDNLDTALVKLSLACRSRSDAKGLL